MYSQSYLEWHFRKLKAQSSKVSFATIQWKETFELWASSFETAFEKVTTKGIGCTARSVELRMRLGMVIGMQNKILIWIMKLSGTLACAAPRLCGVDTRVWLTSTGLISRCGSFHGPDTFWARGLSWINKESPLPGSFGARRLDCAVWTLVFGWPQPGLMSPLRFPLWSRYILAWGVELN